MLWPSLLPYKAGGPASSARRQPRAPSNNDHGHPCVLSQRSQDAHSLSRLLLRSGPFPLATNRLQLFWQMLPRFQETQSLRGSEGSAALWGNMCPWPRRHTLCPQDRERWQGDLGAPNDDTEALCAECVHPSTLKNANASEAILDASKAQLALSMGIWHKPGVFTSKVPLGPLQLGRCCDYHAEHGNSKLGAGGGTRNLHQEPTLC